MEKIEEKILERRAKQRAYYEKNRERLRKRLRAYYAKNKEKYRVWQDNSINKPGAREKVKERKQKYRRGVRKQVVSFLGGVCKRCGFSDWRALQIDHVNGGGTKERNQGPFYDTLKYHLSVMKDTSGKYQLLCANCNWIKRYEQYEERKPL